MASQVINPVLNTSQHSPKYSLEFQRRLPKFNRSVSCLGWAYNEELLIEDYLVRVNDLLSRSVEDYEIIIVDDGSTDRTKEIIQKVQKQIPQVRLIQNEANMNVGYSFQRALQNSIKDYVFWQTVDWAYDLKYFRIFLEFLKDYEVVTGVRRGPFKKSSNEILNLFCWLQLFRKEHLDSISDNPQKAFVSVVNYLLIRLLFGMPLSDFQNVSIFPREMLQSVRYESKSTFSSPEHLIKSYWLGAKIIEVPISFISRKLGKAKGTKPKAIFNSVCDVFSCWMKWILLNRRNFKSYGSIRRFNSEEWE